MTNQVRYFLSRLIPAPLKWWLMRYLSGMVDFGLKFFEGINPIWRTDEKFAALYEICKSRSLMDMRRAYVLYQFAKLSAGVPGAIAEVGMYRGASAKLMLHATAETKPFWGFDTFAGMPPTNATLDPFWSENDLGDTSIEEVRDFLGSAQAHLVPGIFPATAHAVPDGLRFSLVHVDVDIYEAAKDCCTYFYNRLSPHGVIVFDDYGFLSCPGVQKAVDDFFADKPIKPIYLPSGQAVFINLLCATTSS
jgi:O-methyltransferase